MANYKPYATKAINIDGFFRPFKSDEIPITLSIENNPVTIGTTFHDAPGSNYQVPAGKKFKILAFMVQTSTTLHILTLEQSDAEDASTNGVTKFAYLTTATVQSPYWVPVLHEPTIASSKYLNLKIDNTTVVSNILYLLGVEVAN